MILKTYAVNYNNLSKLDAEIRASNYVQTFEGLEKHADGVKILGASLLDEANLDALVAGFTDSAIIHPVTPRQIRLALIASGSSPDAIVSAINSMPEPQKSIALNTWEYSNEFNRDNPLVIQLGPTLGFTPAQLDSLWQLASTL